MIKGLQKDVPATQMQTFEASDSWVLMAEGV